MVTSRLGSTTVSTIPSHNEISVRGRFGATLTAPPGDSQTLIAFGSVKAMQINAG